MEGAFVRGTVSGEGSPYTGDQARTQMLDMGLDLPFRSYAVAGQGLDGTLIQAQQLIADNGYDEELAVLIHTGGNDSFAYDSSTQEQRDSFKNRLEAIYVLLLEQGYHLIPSPLSYTEGDVGARNRQKIGINLIYPLIEQYAPYWWDSVNQCPIMDFYKALEPMDGIGFGDGVHPNEIGRAALREYIYERIRDRMDTPEFSPPDAMTFTVAGGHTRSQNSNIIAPTITGLRTYIGEDIEGSVVCTNVNYTLNITGGLNRPKNYSPVEDHHRSMIVASFSSNTPTFEFSIPSYANRTGVVRFMGVRNNAPASRNTRVRIGSETGLANALSGTPAIVPFTLDSNGEMTMTVEVVDSFNYLNAFTLYFD